MTTPSAIPLYVGYDWVIPVSLTNPDGTTPNISGWTIAGDFWFPGQSQGQSTSLVATNINVSAASFQFVVPKTLTSTIITQSNNAVTYPCRIMVNYTDGSGKEFAIHLIFILPLDWRSSAV